MARDKPKRVQRAVHLPSSYFEALSCGHTPDNTWKSLHQLNQRGKEKRRRLAENTACAVRRVSDASTRTTPQSHLSIPREDENGRVLLGDDVIRSNLALRPPDFPSENTPPPFVCLKRQADEER